MSVIKQEHSFSLGQNKYYLSDIAVFNQWIVVASKTQNIWVWKQKNLYYQRQYTLTINSPMSVKIVQPTKQQSEKYYNEPILIIGSPILYFIHLQSGQIISKHEDVRAVDFSIIRYINGKYSIPRGDTLYGQTFLIMGGKGDYIYFWNMFGTQKYKSPQIQIPGSINTIEIFQCLQGKQLIFGFGDKKSHLRSYSIVLNKLKVLINQKEISVYLSSIVWILSICPIIQKCYDGFTSQLVAMSGSFFQNDGYNYGVQIISWRHGNLIRIIQNLHSSYINVVNFIQKNGKKWIITGSADGKSQIIEIANIQNREVIQPGMVVMHCLRKFGNKLIYGTHVKKQNFIRIYT